MMVNCPGWNLSIKSHVLGLVLKPFESSNSYGNIAIVQSAMTSL